jgi:hypothetical protein
MLSDFRASCSVQASVPHVHNQHVLKGLFQIWKLVHMFRASVPEPYAQVTHQFLMHMLILTRMLNAAPVPDSYA